MTDAIVVGSGPGGVHAAAALLRRGRDVVMLDFGNRDDHYAALIPERPFLELRRGDPSQYRYFLGDRYEGIPLGPVRVGAQLTPPRMYVLAEARERIPIEAQDFAVSISLARGGLGAAWSAGVFPFADDELAAMGLRLDDMQPHYDAVAERIGVCGLADDLGPFFPVSPSMMPPLDLDTNAELILRRYERRRERLRRRGFFLGRARLAVCTRRHRGRGPYAYEDMEYWADFRQAVYRAQWTLEELLATPGFTYVPRRFVQRFREVPEGVEVEAHDIDRGLTEHHRGSVLVLAAGTVATAWIVLRSLGRFNEPRPFLCNAYAYVPTLSPAMLTRPARDRRASLAQLTALLRTPSGGLLQAQVFSYRSLLTFKLMKELPLGFRDGRRLLQVLMPAFAILGIHHEDRPASAKRCLLRRETPDRLVIEYAPSDSETRDQRANERRLLACFRQLGLLPLKTIRPGHGSSLHYAGTFPMVPDDRPLSCDLDGRLRETRAVYLADGSVFPWLPPKGLTFNIMAHADRVGTRLAERLR